MPAELIALEPTLAPLTKKVTLPVAVCPDITLGLTVAVSVTGSLYCPAAAPIVMPVMETVREFDGPVAVTVPPAPGELRVTVKGGDVCDPAGIVMLLGV